MAGEEDASCSSWRWEQDKAFENALADFSGDSPDRYRSISLSLPRKSIQDIKQHYQDLEEDVENIEAGLVPVPDYPDEDSSSEDDGSKKVCRDSQHGGKGSKSEQERRKGIAWTEKEHKQFLLGLERYGKGDWRSISRKFVVTRTPTQVASHAQKYFIRLKSMNKDRRRSSIHDITNVSADASIPQGPITGESYMLAIPGNSSKSPSQPAACPPAIGVYGHMSLPMTGPLVSVGISVSLPGPPHLAYGMGAPVPGTMIPAAQMNIPPMSSYPMPMPPNA